MKKVVAMLLVFVLAFALVACNNNKDDTSKPDPASSAAPAESKPEEKSEEASKEDSKPAEESSKAEESSEEESQPEESSEPAPELPAYNDAFVFVEGQVYGMAATDKGSIRLTKINDVPEAGDVVVFTPEFGSTIEVDGETYINITISGADTSAPVE